MRGCKVCLHLSAKEIIIMSKFANLDHLQFNLQIQITANPKNFSTDLKFLIQFLLSSHWPNFNRASIQT